MSKIKILIVDDDETCLGILEKSLSNNFETATEKNGFLALNRYKTFQPDIIVSDIDMPILNGIEMVKKIRETDKNCKIILLSAHSNVEYLMKATELMLTKYLVKPINPDELYESINIAIKEKEEYDFISKKILKLKHNCFWDCENNSFFKDNEEINLTPKERAILTLLFKNPDSIKTYDEIIYFIWADDSNGKQNLKSLMTGLRKKIPDDIIFNVYGSGYKILTTF